MVTTAVPQPCIARFLLPRPPASILVSTAVSRTQLRLVDDAAPPSTLLLFITRHALHTYRSRQPMLHTHPCQQRSLLARLAANLILPSRNSPRPAIIKSPPSSPARPVFHVQLWRAKITIGTRVSLTMKKHAIKQLSVVRSVAMLASLR